ncbi:E3 ubiquitin-protein ligase makorin-2 isoform X2 [Corythoichthys intestinalis]|uniref:E3 ubiquitin-protein ligase makorin-2 isoform X2 n=1 Tax=Corythoichthys intestinalis TaxID=161448 RepID=UPI0025A57E77|nr:E3 ubiquitin-protein ligase makorin-2 isoform X2 [Corythoichthys intestinalis]XP_061814004.1 E3 ubiquitin-protein ligase makorin-2-like [Nerophis lumbriciformis]
MSTKQVTCRYFLHGVCREGSRCMFSHDPSSSKPSTICKFYQRGVCAYGERCRYDHIKPSYRGGGGASDGKVGPGGGAPLRKPTRDAQGPLDGVFGGPPPLGPGPEASTASPHSYVDAIRTGLEASAPEQAPPQMGGAYRDFTQLCPYAAATGRCFYEGDCPYLHGDRCEVCRLPVLHPHDAEQRRAHEKMCMLAFERDMEKAFAAQLSQDKVCSICMEVVVQKAVPSERRFGILSACCHVFCLACIRQWRCTRNFSNKIIKSCPECRVVSEFVIPSVYWVEEQEDKDNLIELFKSGVSKKACKYFDQGRGSCPFGAKCLYLHAFPDGSRAEADKPRKQLGSEGNVRFMNNVRLWDFIEEREQRPRPPAPDDDMAELRELFMQMSAPGNDGPETPPEPPRQ